MKNVVLLLSVCLLGSGCAAAGAQAPLDFEATPVAHKYRSLTLAKPASRSVALKSADSGSGAAGPKVVLGIGAITAVDGSPESFALYDYLREHPLEVDGARVEVALVDHPHAAEYYVSGRVEGSDSFTYENVHADVQSGQMWAGGGSAFIIMGAAIMIMSQTLDMGYGDVERKRRAFLYLGGGMFTVGVFPTIYGIHKATSASNNKSNIYVWDHSASITLRKKGRRLQEVTSSDAGEVRRRTPAPSARGVMYEGLWEKVSADLAEQIERDLKVGEQAHSDGGS
jgi:hypothetical protein